MEKVKVYFDRKGNTLTVWFGDPIEEVICEETVDEIILIKDKNGRVLGFEKLNFASVAVENAEFGFEAVTL